MNLFKHQERTLKVSDRLEIELLRTEDGGWKSYSTSCEHPDGGSSSGFNVEHMAKTYPWITEAMWRRILELEDKLDFLESVVEGWKERS